MYGTRYPVVRLHMTRVLYTSSLAVKFSVHTTHDLLCDTVKSNTNLSCTAIVCEYSNTNLSCMTTVCEYLITIQVHILVCIFISHLMVISKVSTPLEIRTSFQPHTGHFSIIIT